MSKTKRTPKATTNAVSSARAFVAIGALLLAAAGIFSGLLVWKHFTGTHLPGCGPVSDCAALEASVFGKLPGVGWPVSFLGLAWFGALLWRWLVGRGALSLEWRMWVRVGAAASLCFLIVIVVLQKLCPYCLGAHVANLAFLVLVERAARGVRMPSDRTVTKQMALGFAVVTLVLVPFEWNQRAAAKRKAESAVAASLQEVEEKTRENTSEEQGAVDASNGSAATSEASIAPSVTPTTTSNTTGTTTPATTPALNPEVTSPVTPASDASSKRGFTGRYRLGEERVPYRLVIFSDFQCKDCKRVEVEIAEVMAARSDISLSMKHFPMCTACNSHMGTLNLHPNACWAARAAEAAGKLKGSDGFFQLFRWLYDRSGSFTDAELRAATASMGYAPGELEALMQGDEMLALVHADIEEAIELGIQYTPLVFLNGVELRGWEVPGTVKKALLALDGKAPPRTATADRPAGAGHKYLEDWRVQTPRRAGADTKPHYISGDAASKVQVVVFGDYQEEFTRKMDAEIRRLAGGRSDVGYLFRHFPGDKGCNTKLSKSFTDQGCAAARAAEGAALVGGEEGYRKFHQWMLQQEGRLTSDSWAAGASAVALDPSALVAAMVTPPAQAALDEDLRAANQLGVSQIPQLFVNGRWLPRWQREGDRILEKVFDLAAAGK